VFILENYNGSVERIKQIVLNFIKDKEIIDSRDEINDFIKRNFHFNVPSFFFNNYISKEKFLEAIKNLYIQNKFNENVKNQKTDETIISLFEKQVSIFKDKVALIFGNQYLSYSDLNKRSNKLAYLLINEGINIEKPVGIIIDRSIEMIITILAILKSGGHYVPIDPKDPKDRMNFIIKDSNLTTLIINQKYNSLIKKDRLKIFAVEEFLENTILTSDENPNIKVRKNNLAYINYTSGTTGLPKGVCIEHKSVIRLVRNNSYVNFSPEEIFFQFASIAFDAATFEIWGSLLNGATLVISNVENPTIREFSYILKTYNITTAWLTAGLFHLLVEEDLNMFRSLKQLVVGGDVLSVEHIERFRKNIPDCRLVNGYGPTEGTTFSTCFTIDSSYLIKKYNSVPIGKPISNTFIYVLNEDLLPCSYEEKGEIFISGDGLARGYLNSPELTADKFITNPYQRTINNDRLYRTGDLGFFTGNGDLVFSGRKDYQVKIRGYRIELLEIENVLKKYPDVRNAIALAVDNKSINKKEIVAYILLGTSDKTNLKEKLREYLQNKLPSYMIPSKLIYLNYFPLNRNGKVDRDKLIEIKYSEERYEGKIDKSSDRIVLGLMDIWSEILETNNITVYDSFIDLGGDSIQAVKVLSRIYKMFKVEISLQTFFEIPDIISLVEYIKRFTVDIQEEYTLLNLYKYETSLSLQQEQLLIQDKFVGVNRPYNIIVANLLEGDLNLKMLEITINKILNENEIFRTYFIKDGVEFRQIIKNKLLSIPMEFIDLEEFDNDEKERFINEIIKNEERFQFDLKKIPLIRFHLLQISNNSYIFLLNIHHIIVDGWSVELLLKEISRLYNISLEVDKIIPVKHKVQYSNYINFQKELIRKKSGKNYGFWKSYLKNVDGFTSISNDKPREVIQEFNGTEFNFEIDFKLYELIKDLSKKTKSTTYQILLSTFNILLHKYIGKDDILIGTPIAGRVREEFENVLGMFTNTLPIRTDFSGSPTFLTILKRVKKSFFDISNHQEVSLSSLIEISKIKRDMSYNPLYQITFVLQNMKKNMLDLKNVNSTRLKLKNNTSKYDLSLIMEENEDKLECKFEYNIALFDNEKIKDMAYHFLKILKEVTKEPGIYVANISLIDSKALNKYIVKGKNNIKGKEIIKSFEGIVKKYPNNIALTMQNKKLTYKELQIASNQFANYLYAHGIRQKNIVALHLDRSFELIISILGVLKIGGTFLPLDTKYPKDRIDYMIRDSNADAIITKASKHVNNKDIKVRVIDVDSKKLSMMNETFPNYNANENDLAYIMYTSGSTGNPKGVMIPYRALVNHMEWFLQEFPLNNEDKVLQKTSISFDASIWEIFAPIMSGSKLVLLESEIQNEPMKIIEKIVTEEITIIQFVPTMLSMLMDHEEFLDCKSLRRAFSGGEVLPLELAKKFKKTMNADLINLYGLTETCIDTSYWVCSGKEKNFIPIGLPIYNTDLLILDKSQNIVPIGVTGELHIGGAGIALGYINNKKLTNEKFILNPLNKEKNELIYKTGDLVRYSFNGELEYVGRADNQIKIRGIRIELNEIKNVVLSYRWIKDVVITVHNNNLVGYFVPKKNYKVETSELREYIKTKLPKYMIPYILIQVESLPILNNGKIDYSRLPNVDNFLSSRSQYEQPRNNLEENIQSIWTKYLNIEHIGINDDFFEIGGNSLIATKIMLDIKKILGVQISIINIFKHSNIKDLANFIGKSTSKGSTSVNHKRYNNSVIFDLDDLSEEEERELLEILEGSE